MEADTMPKMNDDTSPVYAHASMVVPRRTVRSHRGSAAGEILPQCVLTRMPALSGHCPPTRSVRRLYRQSKQGRSMAITPSLGMSLVVVCISGSYQPAGPLLRAAGVFHSFLHDTSKLDEQAEQKDEHHDQRTPSPTTATARPFPEVAPAPSR